MLGLEGPPYRLDPALLPRIRGEMLVMKTLIVLMEPQITDMLASAKIQSKTGPPPQDWSVVPIDLIKAMSRAIDVNTVLLHVRVNTLS